MDRQRIDKWLWHARVVRTRSAAAALAASGHVRVNGERIDAPSRAVRPDDVVTVALDRTVRVLRVGALPSAAVLPMTPAPCGRISARRRGGRKRSGRSLPPGRRVPAGRPSASGARSRNSPPTTSFERICFPCLPVPLALLTRAQFREFGMTYIVNDKCIKCKYMDCVEVCPVDCFYEGENMLVIHPDECIDCGVCEPECPVEAIKPDTEPGLESISRSMRNSRRSGLISRPRRSPGRRQELGGVPNKMEQFSSNPEPAIDPPVNQP